MQVGGAQAQSITPDAQRLAAIDVWAQKTAKLIAEVQAESEHRRGLLELHLESNPVKCKQLPFQPSPVLVQLIRCQRQPRKTKHATQSKRSVEYLERKLEAEIRQHYELENAQHCAAWKKLHLQNEEARRALSDQIERDFRALCLQLRLDPRPSNAPTCVDAPLEVAQAAASGAGDAENEAGAWLQAPLHQDWVAQERFNIQEAFTNQTRKLQSDLDEYLAQLEADSEQQRQRILTETGALSDKTYGNGGSTSNLLSRLKRERIANVFKSDAQRKLLLQSAASLSSSSWTDPPVHATGREGSMKNARDVSETDRRIDELQRRLQFLREEAEAVRKEHMAQIGRQCAHMFTQLDCRETGAKLAGLLVAQDAQEMKALAQRADDLAGRARAAC